MSYPKYFNQNTLIINRDEVKKGTGKGRTYITSYQDNILEAMKELDGTAFKVYMLLLFNKSGFRLDYSPQYVANQTGISRDSARAAIRKLETSGFLDWKDESTYDFYEVARRKTQLPSSQPTPDYDWGDGW